MKDIDQIRAKADLQIHKIKVLYDEAEGISAKVKLWFALNSKLAIALAISHVVVFFIGLAL